MLSEIVKTTAQGQEIWKQNKASIQVKSIVNQMTLDIQRLMDVGEWDFAVKLAYYRHELAKVHNESGWYEAYVEIRKTRDLIALLVETSNDGIQKDGTKKATNS